MLDFAELKEAVADGDDEPYETGKAEFSPIESFAEMPEGATVHLLDDYFPETTLWREGDQLLAEITEHIYTKYWEHKWHGRVYAAAMLRAIKRFIAEGHSLSEGNIENDDEPHIFIRWRLHFPVATNGQVVIDTIQTSFEWVCSRADLILDNAETVLVLGKDTGEALDRLRLIASRLETLGYYAVIIKDQPDKLGESVIQKVMRYALSSKFVIVENTDPSGHLYEIPHVGKAAECVIAFLQEEGKGATWMFEDAFARNKHWQKFVFASGSIEKSVDDAVVWAENFVKQFGAFQQRVLPWMKPAKTPEIPGRTLE
ncbi:MAG: hypothetical protein HY299_15080 [Verrucomicrobia bacterium]|nr:hypothetical protein [Verrucomicrobiota bacterium]